jgi:hypothetical protein
MRLIEYMKVLPKIKYSGIKIVPQNQFQHQDVELKNITTRRKPGKLDIGDG